MSNEGFFQQSNLQYFEKMYEEYKKDPNSVEDSLRHFFNGFDAAQTSIKVDVKTGRVTRSVPQEFLYDMEHSFVDGSQSTTGDLQERVFELISAYRKYGHLQARTNPLAEPELSRFLSLKEHGLSNEHLDQQFYAGSLPGSDRLPLRQIISQCEDAYCSSLAVEYVGIVQDVDEYRWLQNEVESDAVSDSLDPQQRSWIFGHLFAADAFESFLHRKYVGQKRFSLEGLDSMIPMLHAALDELAISGAREVILGMAHRGRLNVLTNVLGKPHEQVMAEFEGLGATSSKGDGDVKYHLGYYNEVNTFSGRKVTMVLNPNPSHLELVNPVIQGKVYSRQKVLDDVNKEQVIPILIHGDAAFAGQGINMETLQLSQMRGYAVGGIVHIVADNQVGFTADPHQSRSTRYSTDLFKMADCPVFHANADDPDAAVRAIRMACKYRQKFKKDVCIHLLGYRRYGHNEGDEPSFTQPLMYAKIKKHPRVTKLYREKLVTNKLVESTVLDGVETDISKHLDNQYESVTAKNIKPIERNLEPGWDEVWEEDLQKRKTGVALEVLNNLVDRISTLPDSFDFNKKMVKFTHSRLQNWDSDRIDWAFAEALCFGSLLLEKKRVRLSGQDSKRGTFSQRNLVLYSQKDGSEYIPLNNIAEDQQSICVFNSMLSELAVLGFEYGFALGNPDTLVMWEAQFGDFANGAQAMMDVFIASGESKWQVQNGLVMLLPHGYEGQGPEHSSARLERYLQLCASYNLRVCNTTTPANYFHVLRRQVMKKDRKPLVLMTPKVLLRLRNCISRREDFDSDKVFLKVITGDGTSSLSCDKVKRLIFCSGKLFYELLEYREKNSIDDVELVRLEQLYPFPYKTILNVIRAYPNLVDTKWVQEERKNMGAWTFVESRFRELITDVNLVPSYVGRGEGASPSSGYAHVHREGQAKLIEDAFRKS